MSPQPRPNQAGFATVMVMLLAAVLLTILSVIADLNTTVHTRNQRLARELQEQARSLSFTPQPTAE